MSLGSFDLLFFAAFPQLFVQSPTKRGVHRLEKHSLPRLPKSELPKVAQELKRRHGSGVVRVGVIE